PVAPAPAPQPAVEAGASGLPPNEQPKKRKSEFTFRRMLESSVLFLTVIILLRSVAIEPFGVPTGSMAPAMAGNHKSCVCPRCGHLVQVGSNAGPNNDLLASERGYATAWCPNCYQGHLGLDSVP